MQFIEKASLSGKNAALRFCHIEPRGAIYLGKLPDSS
jgi:hypothetical protein